MWAYSFNCYNGTAKFVSFPDGKSYLEQPNIAIEMFNLLTTEYVKYCGK